MKKQLEMVEEFQRKYGLLLERDLTDADYNSALWNLFNILPSLRGPLHVLSNLSENDPITHRLSLILEEFTELCEAFTRKDKEEVIDAIGDLLYTVLGACTDFQLPIEEIFDRIHASNMTKEKVKNGKERCKGATFCSPSFKEIVDSGSTGL